jgi:dihydrodipicolinate synthase/N-acetylneuraminate lyase
MTFDVRRDLRGIVASLHTPFAADGPIDLASLLRLTEHGAAAGCVGVLATAVAGEVGSLAPEERRHLLRALGEATRARLVLIAGVSANDLATSCALAGEAAEAGAAMVLWQPPPGLDTEGLETALRKLAGTGPVPIMLQDLDWQEPGIDPAVIARLAERVPELVAVKIETVPAGPKYSAVRAATGSRLHLSGGWAATQMLDGLARGLDAFAPSGLLPVYCRIFRLWEEGCRDDARTLFERALPILAFSNQHIEVSIRFWKSVRRRQGILATDACRPPVRPLDAVELEQAETLGSRAIALEAELTGS